MDNLPQGGQFSRLALELGHENYRSKGKCARPKDKIQPTGKGTRKYAWNPVKAKLAEMSRMKVPLVSWLRVLTSSSGTVFLARESHR